MFACFGKSCVKEDPRHKTLTNNEKARFKNLQKYGTPNQVYNQLKKEREHKYTPNEKGSIHRYMKHVNVMSLNNVHSKIMRLRAINSGKGVFGNAGLAYMHNR